MQPSADQPTDRRVTVVEAAAILGITPDAVRSRLRRGTLRRNEAPDGTVLVALSSDGRDGPDASAADRPTDQTTVAYIDGLKSKIEVLQRELVDWKEEAHRKDHLLAAALERIEEPRLLYAPALHLCRTPSYSASLCNTAGPTSARSRPRPGG